MEGRKFYVTPNRILDADVLGDVEYRPMGSPTGRYRSIPGKPAEASPELSTESELVIYFKGKRGWISFNGTEADAAWKNFRLAAAPDRLALLMEETLSKADKDNG
jgi:hypothetical protein